jgi:hypothetical protein
MSIQSRKRVLSTNLRLLKTMETLSCGLRSSPLVSLSLKLPFELLQIFKLKYLRFTRPEMQCGTTSCCK